MLSQEQNPLKVQGLTLEQSKLNAPGLINEYDPERFGTERTTESILSVAVLVLGNK